MGVDLIVKNENHSLKIRSLVRKIKQQKELTEKIVKQINELALKNLYLNNNLLYMIEDRDLQIWVLNQKLMNASLGNQITKVFTDLFQENLFTKFDFEFLDDGEKVANSRSKYIDIKCEINYKGYLHKFNFSHCHGVDHFKAITSNGTEKTVGQVMMKTKNGKVVASSRYSLRRYFIIMQPTIVAEPTLPLDVLLRNSKEAAQKQPFFLLNQLKIFGNVILDITSIYIHSLKNNYDVMLQKKVTQQLQLVPKIQDKGHLVHTTHTDYRLLLLGAKRTEKIDINEMIKEFQHSNKYITDELKYRNLSIIHLRAESEKLSREVENLEMDLEQEQEKSKQQKKKLNELTKNTIALEHRLRDTQNENDRQIELLNQKVVEAGVAYKIATLLVKSIEVIDAL